MDVHSDNLLEGWQQISNVVSTHGDAGYLLTVRVGTAWNETPAELRRLDGIARRCGAERPSSAASMLCPRSLILATGTTEQKIEAGVVHLGRGRRSGLKYSGWVHTYFERLAGSFVDAKGQRHSIAENRLLQIVEKGRSWNLNVAAALNAHIFVGSDSLRTRGSPCLRYVQVRLFDDNGLELSAVYRAHDYFNKALGNFIGLQRLGYFLASEMNRNYRGLYVVSFNPHIDKKGSKAKLGQYANAII